MAFLIPSYIQKRLLRYALSSFDIVDTDSLDPEQLDIAWGKRSSVELRDVALHVKKLSHMLHLPDEFQPTKARIRLLRITVPADIYSSGIEVAVQGIDIQGRLDRRRVDVKSAKTTPTPTKGKSTRAQEPLAEPEDDHIPTAQELAESFLDAEPQEEREELEEAFQNAGLVSSDDSDDASDMSEDENVGTGVGLAVPAFLANFLNGVIDRLQMTIRDVKFILDAEMPSDSDLPFDNPAVSLHLCVSSVEIEGFTHGGPANTSTDSKRRRVKLADVHGDLVTENTLFTSLERVSTAGSKRAPFSAPSSPCLTERSAPSTKAVSSPDTSLCRQRPQSAELEVSRETTANRDDSLAHSRISARSDSRMHSSFLSQDRFADASEDDPSDMAASMSESMRESQLYPASILAASQIAPSEFDNDPEEDLPFMMEDAQSSHSYESQEIDPFAALSSSYGQERPRSNTSRRRHPYASATAPLTPFRRSDSYQLDGRRPQYSSQPAPSRRADLFRKPPSLQDRSPPPALPSPPKSDSSDSPSEGADESLAQSMLYSHEEAQSMYMSALGDPQSEHYDMPGGWGPNASSDVPKKPNLDYPEASMKTSNRDVEPDVGGDETVPPRSPSNTSSSPDSKFRKTIQPQEDKTERKTISHKHTVSKRLISIDEILIGLPWSTTDSDPTAIAAGVAPVSVSPTRAKPGRAMPGAFSQYHSVFSETFKAGPAAPMHARFEKHEASDGVSSLAAESVILPMQTEPDITLDIGNFQTWSDTASFRLLFRLAQQMLDVFSGQGKEGSKPVENSGGTDAIPSFLVKLQSLQFAFMELLPTSSTQSEGGISRASSTLADPLFQIEAWGLSGQNAVAGDAMQVNIDVETFRAGYAADPILSFIKPVHPRSKSGSAPKKDSDLSVVFKSSSIRGHELDVRTPQMKLALNLPKLDERLFMFGGVSGILDLSSSVASNSTVLKLPPSKPEATVHFSTEASVTEAPTLSPIRTNVKLHGAMLSLEGKSCAINIETRTIGVTLRSDYARVKIEEVQVKAPFDEHNPDASPVVIELLGSDITYLVSGAEADFEKLVMLIEPSSDRYEEDEELFIEVLEKQRGKASVLRINADSVQARVSHFHHLEPLQQLGGELGRLSSGVTKYLPEDDRPGILILPSIRHLDFEARLPDQLGLITLSCKQLDIAHVGTPLLAAFRVGHISASREEANVIDALLNLDIKRSAPMVMGRFIGNVPESRMKLKFFNMLLEYRTSMMLAVLGVAEADTIEDLAISMASSVATLKMVQSPQTSEAFTPNRCTDNEKVKVPLRLDVFVRDCAFGLNPQKSDAKALALLSLAQISIDDEGSSGFKIRSDIRRASLLLVDDTATLDPETQPSPRLYDPENRSPAVDDLTREGFTPVASIWSAIFQVNITTDKDDKAFMDVDMNVKLVTLETCADSQTTLATVMGGLSPPLPKEQKQMYRTQVVPIENMLASFTGEAFVQSEANSDEVQAHEELTLDDADKILEDIPSNMDFVGSNYDPSVLGSINRLSSRILAPSHSDQVSFTDSIEEKFDHGPENMLINPAEDYLDVFKFKVPARRWNSKAARLEPIYGHEMKRFPVKVTSKFEQITWNLYDGYDWIATQEKIAEAVEKVEARIRQRRRARTTSAREDEDAESEIEDMLFQSIWISVPANATERDLRRGINKQLAADDYTETESIRTESVVTRATVERPSIKRRKSRPLRLARSRKKISFDLRNTTADFFLLPPGSEETQNSVALQVADLEIFDHVPSSTWKKFLTYLHDAGERQMGRPMIRLDAVTVKPVSDLAATEMIIKANVSPIRLHVDQDALDFLTRFFEFKDEKAPTSSGEPGPYIARLEVNTVPVGLDYKPKKVDYAGLKSGSTSEFANFIILERAEFQLKRLILYGIQSPDLLQPKLKAIWTADVINNQLPTVLAGLSGVRPFVDVGSGIRDLVVVPMREYRKDGRVVRSVQKGAVAFAKTTTSKVAHLGAKALIGTQTVLEGAEALLSPNTDKHHQNGDDWDSDDFSTSPGKDEPRAISNYADQPLNVVAGLRDAWQGLERDLVTARDAIIAIGGDVRESGSALGAVGAVARLAPTVILRPAIGATRGIGMALLGAGNMLDKDSKRRIEDKYKRY